MNLSAKIAKLEIEQANAIHSYSQTGLQFSCGHAKQHTRTMELQV